MQPHEGVGVVPVAAGTVLAVHHHYRGIGVFDQQSVNEGHGGGTSANDEVVGLDVSRGHVVGSRRLRQGCENIAALGASVHRGGLATVRW